MDLSKSYEFFQPEKVQARIHIVGCGSVGSTIAENLVRVGLTNFTLYDFDTVEAHNIGNQMFWHSQIGKPKTEALAQILLEINPEIDLKLINSGYKNQKLSGYVFLCVDNIDLRREIAKANKENHYILAMFDFRTRLTDAQHYAAVWDDPDMVRDFINSMAFTQEEAEAETPVSACKVSLSVAPTVRVICAEGATNFINFIKTGALKKLILIDAFKHTIDSF